MGENHWGFDALPTEIRQLIFSFLDLDVHDVLSTKTVSKEFKKLSWGRLRRFNLIGGDQKLHNHIMEEFIKNANPNLITSINFSCWDNPVESALAMLDKFPNLEKILFNFRSGSDDYNTVISNQAKLLQYPKLNEIAFIGGYWERFSNICEWAQYTNNFYPKAPLVLDKIYHRGGTIGNNLVVVGATDGTLTFLTLKGVQHDMTFEIYSTDNTHKDSINAIWSEMPINSSNSRTYIASSDGLITCWSCTDNNRPELKHVYSFPESILFVSEWASKHVLAAGKQTLYIAEIESGNIIQRVTVHEDITGLFSLDSKGNLSTANATYTLTEGLPNEVVLKLRKVADSSCPNIWLSPDVSLRMTVHPTKVEVFGNETNTLSGYYFNAADKNVKFDTRPHLSRFNPTRFWLTASTGSSLTTYNIAGNVVEQVFATENKEEDLLLQCQSFWYSPDGSHLFGLFSNQQIYWWHCTVEFTWPAIDWD